MPKEGILKIMKECLENVKNGELSSDDFYEIFFEYVDDKERKEQKALDLNDQYRGRIKSLEKMYYEGTLKYLKEHPDAEDLKRDLLNVLRGGI
jgi:hypothetical protein